MRVKHLLYYGHTGQILPGKYMRQCSTLKHKLGPTPVITSLAQEFTSNTNLKNQLEDSQELSIMPEDAVALFRPRQAVRTCFCRVPSW